MEPQFIGQIVAFAFDFAPRGWAKCNGQLLSVTGNEMLFKLLGTTYGGDGETTFGLPDLRGRVALGAGAGTGLSSYVLAAAGGVENVTLTEAQMPGHQHTMKVLENAGDTNSPEGNYLATVTFAGGAVPVYRDSGDFVTFGSDALNVVGGDTAHENRQPYLALNYCIALDGHYPTRD